jgi:hypothetical protein
MFQVLAFESPNARIALFVEARGKFGGAEGGTELLDGTFLVLPDRLASKSWPPGNLSEIQTAGETGF